MNPRLPQPALAVLDALRFSAQPAGPLAGLDENGWNQALDFARPQLALVLRAKLVEGGCWGRVREPVRRRLDQNLADNTERCRKIRDAYSQIADRLAAAGVDFLLLKGFSHCPGFLPDPNVRLQYDIDIYCPGDAVFRAQEVLFAMGYRPATGLERLPTDHLPTLLPASGGRWRGNPFDPEIPPRVELHFRFWDPDTERISIPGLEEFWNRRELGQLDPLDQLGYAALHATRHLLRGTLRAFHVYEIAHFIEGQKADRGFCARWHDLHPPELRRLESIAFRLAELYFGAAPVETSLPAGVELWLKRYGWSPLEAQFHPNKHELYLHMSLLDGWSDKWKVARRRLVPLNYRRFTGARLAHHARVFLPALWGIATWRRLACRSCRHV